MGYVFTPEEFEERKIPTKSGYKTAMGLLKNGLKRLVKKKLIFGANIHGSNMHQDSGIGSDIDVLVVTNIWEAEAHLRELNLSIRNKTFVPIEFVPVTLSLAKDGQHFLDYFYMRYIMTYCKEGIVGEDPFSVIVANETWENPFLEVRRRFIAQLTKIAKRRINSSSEYDVEHCDLLEDIMRQPIYSAIDLLRLKYGDYPADEKTGQPLSKRQCCRLYYDEFSLPLTYNDLCSVLAMREKYRRFLSEVTEKTKEEYIQLLSEVEDILPAARTVINVNLNLLPKLFKGG